MSSVSSTGGSGSLLGGLSGNLVSPTTSSSGALMLSGVASGLNTSQIIQDLEAIQQEQVNNLTNSENQVQAQQSAFQQIQTQLQTLQSDVAALTQTQNSVFNVQTVTSSNQNLATAAANSSAVPGVYSLTVNNLAAASEIASQGFDSATAQITQGTLQISTGSGSTTITINNTNNTLQGLAGAINNAGIGVSASIVDDGSASNQQPFRLLLTSDQTGTANAVSITNNLAADNNGAVQPVFDSTYIGQADTAAGYTGTSVPTSNSGAGLYTGNSNNAYTFTVVNGGTVGTNNIQLSYTDSTGTNTGTLTLGSGDANVLQNVAQGLQVEFSAGTLVTGQSFTVKTYVPTVQQAANASVTVGSGSGALTVQSATNQIDNLIQGVAVNLVGADRTTPVSLTVSNDTSSAATAIQSFVTDYNNLMSLIGQAVSYDPSTNTAGVLLGNSQVAEIQNQVRGIVDSAVGGVNPSLNNLGALGITFDTTGQLQVNQGQLDSVLDGNVSGVSLSDVQRLFGLTGSSTNAGVQFIAGSDQTQASGAAPYQVSITQAAQQASIVATNPLASTTTIDSTNNTFGITVDGQTASTITLKPGTYTMSALAQEVQNEINTQSNLANSQVTVTLNGNQLAIATNSYGSTSQVAIGSGTALTALGFNGTETGTGQDVQGSFLVNGVAESATGSGRILTGNSSNAHTADLEVQVSLTPAQVGTGTVAPLTVARGLASSLKVTLDSFLDPVNGLLTTVNAGFQTTESNIKQQITNENTAMQAKETALVSEFANMEQAVSQLQNIGSFLNQEFNSTQQQQQKL